MILPNLANLPAREVIWKIVGYAGNLVFGSRVYVQWYATEKKRQVVVPVVYWWLSIIGSVILLLYAVCYNKDYVVILAYAFSWIPYMRNLIVHYRHKQEQLNCTHCGKSCPPQSKFCFECGNRLTPASETATK